MASSFQPLMETLDLQDVRHSSDGWSQVTQFASRGTSTLTLVGRLDAFLKAWQTENHPPPLRDFVPLGPREANREALIHFLTADIDCRYRFGWPKRVEEYLLDFPELADNGVPCELIFEEYQARRGTGEEVDPNEYYHRFPQHVPTLRQWFALAEPGAAPTLLTGVQRVLEVDSGQVLDDFHLLSSLGEGTFGRVFLARQNSMQRLVAVKISADRGAEPQMLAQLDHPHIVRVYDQRRVPERGLRLLYMQYVAGGTLQEVVRRVRATPLAERSGALLFDAVDEAVERGGQPSMSGSAGRRRWVQSTWPEMVCHIGAQIALALDYAHHRGVLHRDLKPANVLLAADGSPKLADFNISTSRDLEDTPGAAYFGGSLAYMSPEQLEACHPALPGAPADLDERSDLYALGVLLWELLHGQRPYLEQMHEAGWNATLETMIATRRAGPPAKTCNDAASLMAVLEDVLRRCLAPNPSERYPSAHRLARELQLCLNARAREILQTPPQGWRRWAQQRPMWAGMIVSHGSHCVASAFVILYIHAAIVHKMSPAQQWAWYLQLMAVGLVAFAAGTGAVWWFGREIVAALSSPLHWTYRPDRMTAIRRQTLALGPTAAPVGIFNWTISGLWYGAFLSWWLGGLRASDFLHILLSHVICGCIAVVYPVLAGSLVAIRAYYPALVARSPDEPNDGPELAQLANRASWVLPFAGFVPILALSIIAMAFDAEGGEARRMAVVFVGLAGLTALPLAWRISRMLQEDALALTQAMECDEAASDSPPQRLGISRSVVRW
jgi:serine/threonine protein kinase